nr:autoinducer binding domain-containing protein [Serratia sp. M24T3]
MSSDSHSLFNNILINKAIEEFIERRLFSLLNVKYTYAVMSKKNPSELLTISNYPKKWEIIYKENNYQYIDPIVNIALNSILPFSWNEKIIINSQLKLSIFEIAKKHEVINGYTFVTHDCANNLVTLSVLIDKNNELQIFF